MHCAVWIDNLLWLRKLLKFCVVKYSIHSAQCIAYMDSSKIAIFFVLVLGSTARVYPASQLGTVAPEP